MNGAPTAAQDWVRFRGPNGSGISSDTKVPPVQWDDTKNIKWKTDLPGPGHSSPIIVDRKVFVTCWTGYGVEKEKSQEDLRLHVLCFDRENGQRLWDRAFEPTLPEEPYQDMFREHGYASHTPVTDGKHLWAYFGKSGVVCLDMEGNLIWRKNLGQQLDPDHWGSASSPILFKNILIVTASVESNTIFGLNSLTGEEIWKHQSDKLTSTWSTPVLVPREDDDRPDLVLPVPYEFWGFNPETGKLRWTNESLDVNAACSSAITDNGNIYFVERGRRGGGSVAVRGRGQDADSSDRLIWRSRHRGHIGLPIVYDEKLIWISSGIVTCVGTNDGEVIFKARLKRPTTNNRNSNSSFPETGTPGGHHSSPVAADGKIYYVSRNGDVYVIKIGDQYEQIAVNSFTEGGDFSASPAISNGELFIRSTKMLYCVGKEK